MVKSRIMRWVRFVESIEHKIKADKDDGGISCREKASCKHDRQQEGDIKRDVK
jgi:hypothetical protein